MKKSHSNVPVDLSSHPVPGNNPSRLKVALTKMVGEDPYKRFGTQLLRISSDMIAICDEDLEIVFHNRAFVKGLGYRDGSFARQSLLSFFPAEDRPAAESAFSGLGSGNAAGLRINASVLTRRKISQFDIRVVKSRKRNGDFLYYLIAREENARTEAPRELKAEPVNNTSFFDSLPIAVWRTDRQLKITNAEGSLWKELGIDVTTLIGESVEPGNSSLLPDWFKRLDFCDTMAGHSANLEVLNDGGSFDITVQPVLNEKSRVVGTIGFLRKSKIKIGRNTDAESQVLVPNDTLGMDAPRLRPAVPPAQEVEPLPVVKALPETVKVGLPDISEAAERAKASDGFQAQSSPRQVYPRPMTPPDLDDTEKKRRATCETKAVALSR